MRNQQSFFYLHFSNVFHCVESTNRSSYFSLYWDIWKHTKSGARKVARYFRTGWAGRWEPMMKSRYRGWLCLVAMPKAIVFGTVFKGSVCNLNSKKTLLDLLCLGFIFKLCQNPQSRIFLLSQGFIFLFLFFSTEF